MKPEEVRNLNWVKVEDWGELTQTYGGYIAEVDIDNFVENIFKDICRKLNISSEILIPILKEENTSFYEIKNRIFQYYGKFHDYSHYQLIDLEKTLRIPDVTSVPMVPKTETKLSVEKVLEDFSKLPDIEKIEVLKCLELFEVKVELKPR